MCRRHSRDPRSELAKRTSRRKIEPRIADNEELAHKGAGELPAWINEPAVAEWRLAHIRRTMSRIIQLLLTVTIVSLSGCYTKNLSLADPQLAPMLQAIAAVDRAALGFTPIPTNAEVLLDSRSDARYDATLIIFDTPARYGGVYRNIEFRKTATGYKWLREFETHPGPRTFKQLGNKDQQWHTAHEEIVIIYDTTGISGVTSNKLHIHYNGLDSRIADRKDLSLDEVRPILAEWSQKR